MCCAGMCLSLLLAFQVARAGCRVLLLLLLPLLRAKSAVAGEVHVAALEAVAVGLVSCVCCSKQGAVYD